LALLSFSVIFGGMSEVTRALSALSQGDPHAARQRFIREARAAAAKIDELRKALPQCRIEWDGGTIEPTGPNK
jgi:hypothetical protein